MDDSGFFAASAAGAGGGTAAGALCAAPVLGGTGNGPCCWAAREPQQNMASTRHPVIIVGRLLNPLPRFSSPTIRFRSHSKSLNKVKYVS
jgi:hypothetical protein